MKHFKLNLEILEFYFQDLLMIFNNNILIQIILSVDYQFDNLKKFILRVFPFVARETTEEEKTKPQLAMGDILYILQDTNKMQENRISYLPKFIDFFTNGQFKKKQENNAKINAILKKE